MVVIKPETSVAVIPGEGQITWAYKFARFTHGRDCAVAD